MSGITLLLSDRHGVYIPREFARLEGWEITDEDREILLAGPEHEQYWDSWMDVVETTFFEDDKGHKWYLRESGDLWAYCPELMTEEEEKEFFEID